MYGIIVIDVWMYWTKSKCKWIHPKWDISVRTRKQKIENEKKEQLNEKRLRFRLVVHQQQNVCMHIHLHDYLLVNVLCVCVFAFHSFILTAFSGLPFRVCLAEHNPFHRAISFGFPSHASGNALTNGNGHKRNFLLISKLIRKLYPWLFGLISHWFFPKIFLEGFKAFHRVHLTVGNEIIKIIKKHTKFTRYLKICNHFTNLWRMDEKTGPYFRFEEMLFLFNKFMVFDVEQTIQIK